MTAPTTDLPGMAVTEEQPERLPDMEVITGEGATVTVAGIQCTVKPVRTRAFRGLMGLFYAGIGPALSQVRVNFQAGTAQAVGEIVGLLMIAVHNATDEALLFLLTVLDAGEEEAQQKLRTYLLGDPDPLELIDAVEAVATQEAPHIVEILGKAQAAWRKVAPLYQKLMPTPKPGDGTESGDGDRSPKHST